MTLAITLHLLAAVIWVGGMFFAYMTLRPAAGSLLETPVRLTLWAGVLKRFFFWVWISVIVLLGTGLWMTFAALGGLVNAGIHVHTMLGLGILMMFLFMWAYFGPFRRLQHAIVETNWETAGARLEQIRVLVKTNLMLGMLVIIIATGGRYWF